jgi:hypothetical protein
MMTPRLTWDSYRLNIINRGKSFKLAIDTLLQQKTLSKEEYTKEDLLTIHNQFDRWSQAITAAREFVNANLMVSRAIAVPRIVGVTTQETRRAELQQILQQNNLTRADLERLNRVNVDWVDNSAPIQDAKQLPKKDDAEKKLDPSITETDSNSSGNKDELEEEAALSDASSEPEDEESPLLHPDIDTDPDMPDLERISPLVSPTGNKPTDVLIAEMLGLNPPVDRPLTPPAGSAVEKKPEVVATAIPAELTQPATVISAKIKIPAEVVPVKLIPAKAIPATFEQKPVKTVAVDTKPIATTPAKKQPTATGAIPKVTAKATPKVTAKPKVVAKPKTVAKPKQKNQMFKKANVKPLNVHDGYEKLEGDPNKPSDCCRCIC